MAALLPILYNAFGKSRGGYKPLGNKQETKTASLDSTYIYPTPKESSYIYEFPTEPLVTPYDIIIRINSITALSTTGWDIILGQNTKDTISKISTPVDKRGVIVSVVGSYNRGKSFLLNQLCNTQLPNGNLVHTEGISITAGRNLAENIIFIDTAGTDTPTPRDKLDDKKATEALLREIALNLCSYIIIVVNRLRATDQSYIQQVVKHCENFNSNKNIIIVHNLMDVQTIKDANKIIKEEVEDLNDAKPDIMKLQVNRTSTDIDFYHSKQNGITIRHFIFARDGFEAGNKWNRKSIDGIMNILQTAQDCRRNLDVINEMINFVNTKLPQLFTNNREQDNHLIDNNSRKLQVQMHVRKPHIVLTHRRELEDLEQNPYPLILSPKLLYDDAGYFIGIGSKDNGQWQPIYNLYETDTEIHAIVELAGFKQGESHVKILEEAIIIDGNRDDFKKTLINPEIHHEKIPMGKFKIEIRLKCRIDPDKSSAERAEGLWKIVCEKKKPASKTFE
ncbi:unnamed protein product [Adineta steineri]|uniref:SHSP domain-containing protein n=1 Tax=Adineta steineri TaxID=433720 RepID=A0A816EJN6_9BILA|nr:unnamed protein product [Adineta steineri]CAF1651035.1 unnamed protein product [Adineta steineri]